MTGKFFSYGRYALDNLQIRSLCKMLPQTQVRTLLLFGNGLTDLVAPLLCRALCSCPGLKSLDLSRNLLSSESVDHLMKLAAHPPLSFFRCDSLDDEVQDEKLRTAWQDAGKCVLCLQLMPSGEPGWDSERPEDS